MPIHSKGKMFDEFPSKKKPESWVRAAAHVEEYFQHLEEVRRACSAHAV